MKKTTKPRKPQTANEKAKFRTEKATTENKRLAKSLLQKKKSETPKGTKMKIVKETVKEELLRQFDRMKDEALEYLENYGRRKK